MLVSSVAGLQPVPFIASYPVEACVNEGLAALAANRSRRISGYLNRATVATVPRSVRTRMFGAMNRSMAEQASRAASVPEPAS